MALSKLQSVVILVICSLLVTSLSRGPRKNNQDWKSQCGPPNFPPMTIGLCQASPRGHGNICCCAKD
ncbi:unnamed protein product [Brassica oleracea var. botrytis]|uniref:Uncharacterized protein n=3 Tax=Brassica TaxID=3705 RepID=A0A8X7UU48_BRACI|nr:hypothetical protein Bca52824_038929 [Brassica carinata]KAG2292264.1 hypothetical protein Bca52824_038933 [Brassica carinata]CAF1712745.1 unnamed protein product [Brassica napus]CDY71740.1 BnaAnng38650D [Brassica napus]